MINAWVCHADDRVTLYSGDALAVLADLPAATVDAVVTDPPYSSGGMVRGDRTGQTTKDKYVGTDQVRAGTGGGALLDCAGDNRDQRAYAYWCALWMGEALRATKPGGTLLVFTDWRQLPSTADAVQAGGWVWRGIIPWVKTSARPQSGRPTNIAEYVLWCSNGPMPVDYSRPVMPGFHEIAAPRTRVHITQKHDQRTGRLTSGVVKDILTKSAFHSRGIKVRLQTGEVGRVQEIVETSHTGGGRCLSATATR